MNSLKGISKITKTLGYYKSNYSAGTHSSEDVSAVQKVNKAGLVLDNHEAGNEQIEEVYSRLRDVASEYREFFRAEQQFEDTLSHVEIEEVHFVDELVDFFMMYNKVLEILREFDKHFGTSHHKAVENIVEGYKDSLSEISVVVEPDMKLGFFKERLMKVFEQDVMKFHFIVDSGGMAERLLERFRSVRSVVITESKADIPEDQIHGMIVDLKL